MEASAIYVLVAALLAFILPIANFQEGFKIQVESDFDLGAMVDGCKKPFISLSDGIKNRIYRPTRKAIIGVIPFKPYYRRQKRHIVGQIGRQIERLTKRNRNNKKPKQKNEKPKQKNEKPKQKNLNLN